MERPAVSGVRLAVAALVLTVYAPLLCCVDTRVRTSTAWSPGRDGAWRRDATVAAGRDPERLLREALVRCRREVRSYRCTLRLRERVGGRLTLEQVISVTHRTAPEALELVWRKNVDRVQRLVYRRGAQVNEQGAELAFVEPAGTVAKLCADRVAVPVDGALARESSRYPLTEFGFERTLRRMIRVIERARANGELGLQIVGRGRVDSRPTIVLERRLPESGVPDTYPDALMVLQLDEATLLPVAIHSFADQAGKSLLGSYIVTGVELNPRIADTAFTF